jgi:hypothetical protein
MVDRIHAQNVKPHSGYSMVEGIDDCLHKAASRRQFLNAKGTKFTNLSVSLCLRVYDFSLWRSATVYQIKIMPG